MRFVSRRYDGSRARPHSLVGWSEPPHTHADAAVVGQSTSSVKIVAISIEDLQAIAARVRRAADEAGELHPPHVGPISVDLPQAIRDAIAEDLKSGAYQHAAAEMTAGDADVAQR